MPGGVNSPVRAFEPYPFFTSHAKGSKLYDVDGNVYIDYCLAYGPLLLGHAHSKIIEAVKEQLEKGTIYGCMHAKIPAQVNGVASMFQIFFTNQPVIDYVTAKSSDKAKFMRYQSELMKQGVFIPPSQFETCFISIAHTDEDSTKTLEAMDAAINAL